MDCVLHFNVAKGEQSQQKNEGNGLENKRLLFILTRNKKYIDFFNYLNLPADNQKA